MKRILMISVLLLAMVLMMSNIWNKPIIIRKGYIKGSIAESSTLKALDCSSIALTSKLNPGVTFGTLSDRRGNFYIHNIPFGKYYVSAFMIGYKKALVKEIEISKNTRYIDLGKILLQENTIDRYNPEISASRVMKGNPYAKSVRHYPDYSDVRLSNYKNNL